MRTTVFATRQHQPRRVLIVFASAVVFGVVVAALTAYLPPIVGLTPWVALAVPVASGVIAGPLVYVFIYRELLRDRPTPVSGGGDTTTELVDPVTRLLNRRGITTSLLEAMAQAQRYGTPLSMSFIKLDQVPNQSAGRTHGTDRLLQLAAAAMTEVVRLPDRMGRHDEQEFLLVMPHTKGPAAAKVVERLREAANLAEGTEPHTRITVSAGIAEFIKGQDLEQLIGQARHALTQAIEAGGDRAVRAKAPRRRRTTA